MKLKTYTLDDIRGFEPCYDPVRHAAEGWTGTVLDVLKMDSVPADDRIWFATRQNVLDDRTARLFAVWCARQALALVESPDARSVAAVDTAERFANGEATEDELAAARAAAREAAWAAAREAAREAARAAAWAAARDADWAAARAAAREAARAAARDAQIGQLITMLDEE